MLDNTYVETVRDWLLETEWTYFVTLNPNINTPLYRVSPDFIQKQRSFLKRWQAKIDRRFLGPRWQRKPPSLRTRFVAFPERGPKGDLLHWHCLLKPACSGRDLDFERVARDAFDSAWIETFIAPYQAEFEVVPKGQIDIRPYHRASARYSTKKLWSMFGSENFVLSEEFQG